MTAIPALPMFFDSKTRKAVEVRRMRRVAELTWLVTHNPLLALCSNFSKTHTYVDGCLDRLLAHGPQIVIELDPILLEGYDDRRATKLEQADLVALSDLDSWLLISIINTIQGKGGGVSF